ncbi:hypothetical protein [Marinactinospora rubrisoli]|uniref:Uncharacterized protein n=1 Tax=Marinactinospora rubrisoli TaxID=2715399 RepID=A0ABW2KL55_9ACTN
MSLALIIVGAALVSVALFNRVPRIAARRGAERPQPPGGAPFRVGGAGERGGARDQRHRAARPQRYRVTAGPAPDRRASRIRAVPARLTETGRATLTAVGGSMLIAAVFLALSGL